MNEFIAPVDEAEEIKTSLLEMFHALVVSDEFKDLDAQEKSVLLCHYDYIQKLISYADTYAKNKEGVG